MGMMMTLKYIFQFYKMPVLVKYINFTNLANLSKQSKDAITCNEQNVFLQRVDILHTFSKRLSFNAIE